LANPFEINRSVLGFSIIEGKEICVALPFIMSPGAQRALPDHP
jgi:hypothetical protein